MDVDAETGYPPGYTPGWWICLSCGERWHDSEQRGLDVCWDAATECDDCDCDMVREAPLTSPANKAAAALSVLVGDLIHKTAGLRADLDSQTKLLLATYKELEAVSADSSVSRACGYCGLEQPVTHMEFGDTCLPALAWRCVDAGTCDRQKKS